MLTTWIKRHVHIRCFATFVLLFFRPARGREALHADDECSSEGCALNALQRHSLARQQNVTVEHVQHPALCDANIVAETCEGINKLTSSYFGTTADEDLEVVHAAEIAEHIMASPRSVREFLSRFLGLQNREDDQKALAKDAVAVNCMDLCEKLVASIPMAERPPSSDVACYRPSGKVTCDIDVSANAFDGIQFSLSSGKSPAVGEERLGEGLDFSQAGLEDSNGSKEVAALKDVLHNPEHINTTDDLQKLISLNYPALKPGEMTVAICNLFRIYPLNNIVASTPSSSLLETSGSDWANEVVKMAVKAQAYTAIAIRSITSAKADETMMLWFGDKSTSAKKEVRRIANQVNRLLSNVDYKYPGPQCQANVYAYVHPNPPHNKNKRGQYLFYLCEDYMTADMATQLETLTHEASHHEMSLTDDVCYKGEPPDCLKAYGRVACLGLANTDPSKALKNADNFCFFVNDIQPNAHTPACPSLPRCSFDKTCSCSSGLVKREEQTQTGSICYSGRVVQRSKKSAQ